MIDDTLQSAIEQERAAIGQLPPQLPIAHLTASRWFSEILDVGELRPRPCSVFGRNLLYLSYGGLFYRPKRVSTQRATELPIGLVFSPVVLEAITSLFPFDTGAMANGGRFNTWKEKLAPFETRFCLSTSDGLRDAATLVKLLYADNLLYLRGEVAVEAAGRPDPFPLLAEFLAEDMTPSSDHRQRSIECLTEMPVALGRHLLWIGFPDAHTDEILRGVHRWSQPVVPDFRAYPCHLNFNPADIGAQLEAWAYDDVIRRYAELRT